MPAPSLLITGDELSIVKATTKVLLHVYVRVLITGRDEKKLQNVVQTLGGWGVIIDVATPTNIDKTFVVMNNP
jgi:short-subunit dehydrogenase involved in D-alanine esterification of teichoic acids